ncbi:Mrp/NBP35 family ATP-binding protein [Pseudobacteriovorax antillogorgiicola]|uniref:Iron-sulfur cluster carrier protein n=1 Tax=Pseudobacteriovorax antillogorgiicola TaxID=1513793 RepID=A0A1Y6CB32_9BACT|nr:Mrp/NBP35 family ATP-binding protein [Pseudobacteriovorax antillogorgiicola]TCS48667.1 Mrp family chromosome partitioning ATPase [Pseudobacteriovorax antillogorgiicola]SMF55028.1 Chromosome partitioning ATPase, Mrp family, contains Fe-S cluster [Pseudobacteriovorax antillogorgiicola]
MTEQTQQLETLVRERLKHTRGLEELGLDADADPQDRIIAIEATDLGYRVKIASDGLNLNHKVALEGFLVEGIPEDFNISIYFKRLKQTSGISVKSAGPAPMDKPKTGPFGFPIQKRAIPGVSKVIAVSSGKGGVGKSTVSTNLAVSLAKAGQKVGLLDADIYGPSAPLMLGLTGPMPVIGGNRIVPLEGHGVKCVSFGFMTDESNPVIWRGPMVAKALKQMFYETAWGELDYLVIDLPPGTGDVQMTMIEQLPIHAGVIVTTPQNVALLDAHKGLTMFQKLKVPVLGVVENMSHFSCPKCGHEEAIFGDGVKTFSEQRDLPIIGQIPLLSKIREAADSGRPIAADDGYLSSYYSDLAKIVVNQARQ